MAISIIHLSTVHYRYDVRIMMKYSKSLAQDADFEMKLVVADGKNTEVINGLKIIDIGKLENGRLRRFLQGNYRAILFLSGNKADLVHVHDPELFPTIVFLKLLGRKVIFDMHENFPLQILTKHYLSLRTRKILSFIAKKSQNLLFRFVPVIFAEYSYKEHFKTVRNSVTILNFPLKSIQGQFKEEKFEIFTLGYMGGVNVQRGTIKTLETVKNLRKNGHLVNVVFVGPYDSEITSNQLYQESISEGWAKFYGRLKPEQGWQIMAKCHVGLAVLQNSPNFRESYPTKMFEYMLLGLPIIVSDFPLYEKIVEECKCGFAVDSVSIEEISMAVVELYLNQEKAHEMGRMGKQIALKKYTWESEFEKAKNFYDKVLNI